MTSVKMVFFADLWLRLSRLFRRNFASEKKEENLKYAAKAKPNMLTPAEREALGAAIYAYRHAPGHIDCTGCYQCIPCPHNVAIGYIFAYVYNNYILHKNKERAMAAKSGTTSCLPL